MHRASVNTMRRFCFPFVCSKSVTKSREAFLNIALAALLHWAVSSSWGGDRNRLRILYFIYFFYLFSNEQNAEQPDWETLCSTPVELLPHLSLDVSHEHKPNGMKNQYGFTTDEWSSYLLSSWSMPWHFCSHFLSSRRRVTHWHSLPGVPPLDLHYFQPSFFSLLLCPLPEALSAQRDLQTPEHQFLITPFSPLISCPYRSNMGDKYESEQKLPFTHCINWLV